MLFAKQVVEDLRPWIELEKAEHIRRAVTMAKRGLERIGKLWDAEQPIDPKRENLAASSLDKHDEIVRRNLGPASSAVTKTHSLNNGHVIEGRFMPSEKSSLR